jgi:PAS domain S-box-containing protein
VQIAERRRADQELRSANQRLREEAPRGRLAAIVDSSEDAIVSKTLDGIITSWNQGAQRIFGYAPSQAIGRSTRMLFPADRMAEETDILQRVGRGERIASFETARVRQDGEHVDVSVTISPIRDDNGSIVGASKIARDITQAKRSQELLLEQTTRGRSANVRTWPVSFEW